MTAANAFPHGSPRGYELGCRSKGGCSHHRDPTTLTCVEAGIAARGDRTMAQLSPDQPLPRRTVTVATTANLSEEALPAITHGTVWRYRRGCTDSRRCPHWQLGRVTCAEARKHYFTEYHARRRSGDGTPINHGTSAGCLSGCTSDKTCPGGQQGRSCHEARAAYRRTRARAQGIDSPAPTIAAREAARLVAELARTPLTGREIARVTGVGRSTIARLLTAHQSNTADGLHIQEATLTAIRAGHEKHQPGLAVTHTTKK